MLEHRFNTDSSDDLIVNVNPAVDAHVIDVGGVVTTQQPSAAMIHNCKQTRTHTQRWCERAHIKLDASDSYYVHGRFQSLLNMYVKVRYMYVPANSLYFR